MQPNTLPFQIPLAIVVAHAHGNPTTCETTPSACGFMFCAPALFEQQKRVFKTKIHFHSHVCFLSRFSEFDFHMFFFLASFHLTKQGFHPNFSLSVTPGPGDLGDPFRDKRDLNRYLTPLPNIYRSLLTPGCAGAPVSRFFTHIF